MVDLVGNKQGLSFLHCEQPFDGILSLRSWLGVSHTSDSLGHDSCCHGGGGSRTAESDGMRNGSY